MKKKKRKKKKKKFWMILWIVVFSILFVIGLLQLLGVAPYTPYWAALPPIYKMGFSLAVIIDGLTGLYGR